MTDRLNQLSIYSADDITLVTPKGSIAGFRWDGTQLVHRAGQTMRFVGEVSDQIAAGVAAARPAVYEGGCNRWTEAQGCPLHGETCGEDETSGAPRLVSDSVVSYIHFAREEML